MDVAATVVTLPIVVPLIATLGAVSAIRFRCQPFFVQERYGVDEETLRVIKIRSLPRDFNSSLGKQHLDESEFCRWTTVLRKSHLDELPQVFNVLGGSMSLVGPRPMIKEVVEELTPEDRAIRARVKTGMTGPWQVSAAGTKPLHECPGLDKGYVAHASFRSDLKLLALTALPALGRTGPEPEELTERLGW